jgi:hypothetical protein
VFSQWGEDGIIQYLIREVAIERTVFVEFGVGNYRESNTRFLLSNNNWSGLIIDSGTAHLRFLDDETDVSNRWKYDIVAVSAFLDTDNINSAISSSGVEGDIGLLSIDVDGNDYWLLDALSVISPRIIVAEYNSIFGPRAAVTIPYDPHFQHTRAHFSGLYFGASLAALCEVLDRKGYRLVGCNSAGVNAFFVRRDVIGKLPVMSAEQGYVASRLQQSRDELGRMSHVRTHAAQLRLIANQPLWDVRERRLVSVAEVYGFR